MKILTWNQLNNAEKNKVLLRPIFTDNENIEKITKDIIQDIKTNQDAALIKLTEKYDRVKLNTIKVLPDEFQKACAMVPQNVKDALTFAKQQIKKNHKAFYPNNQTVETCEGVFCEKQFRPIERVGLYVPGGSAPLVSTVLMLGIPAKIANCSVKILCTPPDKNGQVNHNILYAAKICGITDVYKVGGVQAIAAMAYGTQTIPKVYKIFGPGNSWVTTAKMLISKDPKGATIDMPAGPSELMIIADDNANPDFIAADLLSQAEHGIDSQVILIALTKQFAKQVQKSLDKQLRDLSRDDFAKSSLANGCIIIVENIKQALLISNQYAPEHLILQVANPQQYIQLIQNAGAVFLGQWSAETLGDYVTGSNHVLPTCGYARTISGLSVTDFMKAINFQVVTKSGLEKIGFIAETIANIEGLNAHKHAVSIRL